MNMQKKKIRNSPINGPVPKMMMTSPRENYYSLRCRRRRKRVQSHSLQERKKPLLEGENRKS